MKLTDKEKAIQEKNNRRWARKRRNATKFNREINKRCKLKWGEYEEAFNSLGRQNQED